MGKAWTDEEDQQLKGEFDRREPLTFIATKHGRTVRAIEARLDRLGLRTADRRMANNSTLGTPANKGEGE